MPMASTTLILDTGIKFLSSLSISSSNKLMEMQTLTEIITKSTMLQRRVRLWMPKRFVYS